MQRIIQILFGIFLFTFPFSIRWVIYEPASYRFGNFNPWVTGFLYLPEVLLGVIFVLWIMFKFRTQDTGHRTQHRWLWGLFGLFAANAFVVTLFAGDSMLGAMFVLRLFEALVVFWLLVDRVLEFRRVVMILIAGAVFQVLLGYGQWLLNGSVGLGFLGESTIGPDVLGVAKTDLVDESTGETLFKQIRAYGTFLHPNIFAAYLLIVFFLALRFLKYGYKLLLLAFFVWGIYLTGSQAAMIVGLIGLGLYVLFAVFKKMRFRRVVVASALLVLAIGNTWLFVNSKSVESEDQSASERLEQNVLSAEMLKEHPFGVGVRNYTLELENISETKLKPWEFQPVHNTYFLILNETGVQGLVILVAFLLLLFFRYWHSGSAVPVLVLILLASFDHFLWDSWVALMLIAIVAGFFVEENHKKNYNDYIKV